MKIAVLSDIHGNYLALQQVLTEVRKNKVKYILVLGDVVGYYYHPDKIFEALEEFPTEFIKGNHECMLLESMGNSLKLEKIHKKYGSGINFAIEKLSNNWINKIRQFPNEKKIVLDGLSIQLCHGSPWDNDVYVYPNADLSLLRKCAQSKCNFIFIGHTHYPFLYCHKNSIVVNVGSVGQARDKGGKASWGLMDTTNRTFVLKHTVYDPTDIIVEVKNIDPHVPYLHEILNR